MGGFFSAVPHGQAGETPGAVPAIATASAEIAAPSAENPAASAENTVPAAAMPEENAAPPPSRPLRAKDTALTGPAVRPPRAKYAPLAAKHTAAALAGVKDTVSGEKYAPLLELPGIDHPLTRRYIERYSQPGLRKWLASTLKAGEPYLAFIRGEIERRGLPPYLLYLPVIESGFAPGALSRSGASGLWQFMRNSIRPYMQINEWLDERRDFYKSTYAALSKLEYNYKEFGDWYLALAAYNSGAGAIASVIKQTGIRDYWELNEKNKLKKETAVYIPKLLAVYTIVHEPRRFGLDIDWTNEVYEWELVPVSRQVDIMLLAGYAGLPKDALHAANRELVFNITPPVKNNDTAYTLKVRKEYAAAVRSVLEQENLPLVHNYIHVIRQGDTLSALALRYGISVETLIAQNPGIKPTALQLGARLLIPAMRNGASPPAADAPPPTAAGNTDNGGAKLKIWRVVKGDTLYSIARQNGATVEALAAKNGMRINDTLSIGRILELP
ncbi:MAG: transglycosylase SLT domain-containing protein [Spirochaetaceae bacterium]|nr:transglycosylase SLT domain-containing protein [Spirochaetaceae bacterium]